jgi:phosphatidate cytidylyltransferase
MRLQRELFAAVAIPIVVAVILWAPAWALLVLVAGVVLVAGDELLGMARRAGLQCPRWLPLAALAGILAAAWIGGPAELAAAAILTVVLLPTIQLARPEAPTGGLSGTAVACFTALYLGLTGACLGWLRLWPEPALGIKLVLLYLFTIWVGDSGAYYVGSRFGRHKMSPRISPNKTWEGLAGGGAATLAGACILNLILGRPLEWNHLLAVAVVLAVAAPLGDLVESLFKRDTGIKDSSTLIPGHGGFLDRTDSLLFAAPPVLGYLLLAGVIA